ncbi:MAG: tyrosine-type recombinase/integrase [Lachnospiraceae bacterium]|nr:tyrosine-type recombinase/integrase [Lachnospiraceae bacterium]
MAEFKSDYYKETNRQYREKLESQKVLLPRYMRAYINRIVNSKAIRTCLAYTGELLNFMKYIRSANPLYKDMQEQDIPFSCIENLTYMDIDEYQAHLVEKKGAGAAARKRTLSALSSYFKYEVTITKALKANPVEAAEKPSIKEKGIKRLNKDDVSDLLHGVEVSNSGSDRSNAFTVRSQLRDTAIVTLFLGTGIRVSELVGLDIQDIDFKVGNITVVRKGGNVEQVYFNEDVRKALSDYISLERPNYLEKGKEEPALFLSNRKKRMAVRSVEEMLRKYGDANLELQGGQTLHPHTLRRTYGTALYNATGDIRLVADALGHKSVNTTQQHYAAIEEEHRAKTGELYLYGSQPEEAGGKEESHEDVVIQKKV